MRFVFCILACMPTIDRPQLPKPILEPVRPLSNVQLLHLVLVEKLLPTLLQPHHQEGKQILLLNQGENIF